MTASDLLSDLQRAGVRLEAVGERLRYFPRSAVTPELVARLREHKAELLAVLRPEPEATNPASVVCRCGSTKWTDTPIHGGQSIRRDCQRCGRFLEFPIWYGKDTRQGG
jgi:hypothetical protein